MRGSKGEKHGKRGQELGGVVVLWEEKRGKWFITFLIKDLKFIKENKSNYTAKINPEKDLEEQNLLYETKVILSVLYRDYWASQDERELLLKNEKSKLMQIEDKKQETYNYDSLFKRNNSKIEENFEEIKSLVVRENLIKKILNKIKRIFRLGVN